MKTAISILLFVVLPFASLAHADETRNFVITIDGKDYDIGLDTALTAKTKAGAEVTLKLKQKEFSIFSQGSVSFAHRSDLAVGSSKIDKDISQFLASSALGTMLLVQQYDSINPATLVELMLHQLSKDDVAGGAKLEKKDHKRTLQDGTVMTGIRATLQAPGEDVVMEILAADEKSGGTIAITRIDKDTAPDEGTIIEKFWETLKIK